MVYDDEGKQISKKTQFRIGQESEEKFLHGICVSQIFIHPNYIKNINQYQENKENIGNLLESEKWDIALLKLKKDIGTKLGWTSLKIFDEDNILSVKVHVSGYPAQKSFNSYLFQEEYGMFDHEGDIVLIDDSKIYYNIDTSAGQSGAGIWSQKNEEIYCYGIHTGTNTDGNGGVRIREEILDFIAEHISK